ncbi:hypothetical protein VIGAN_11045500 [Vigna angularis var. angularis]|uniref:Uncharacterized protein n=1 Tax=Vigna angularis var. angularis TaxID=157739 RepID=A0A0S3T7N1_PHAAN|nr:hypothetical protein VIGAN_11045500 [Vigna angularis var. angularis]
MNRLNHKSHAIRFGAWLSEPLTVSYGILCVQRRNKVLNQPLPLWTGPFTLPSNTNTGTESLDLLLFPLTLAQNLFVKASQVSHHHFRFIQPQKTKVSLSYTPNTLNTGPILRLSRLPLLHLLDQTSFLHPIINHYQHLTATTTHTRTHTQSNTTVAHNRHPSFPIH